MSRASAALTSALPSLPRSMLRFRSLTALAAFALLAGSAFAQFEGFDLGGNSGNTADGLFNFDEIEPEVNTLLRPAGGKAPEDLAPGDEVVVAIQIVCGDDVYTYGLDSGPASTAFKLEFAGLEEVDDVWKPNHKPKIEFDPTFKTDLQKYPGGVTWTRTYKLADGATSRDVRITGRIDWQVCGETCTPYRNEIDLALVETSETDSATDNAKASDTPAEPVAAFGASETQTPEAGTSEVTASLSKLDAQVGETVTLTVRFKLDDGWHMQALTRPPGTSWSVTELKLAAVEGLQPQAEQFTPDRKPKDYVSGDDLQYVYYGTIDFQLPLEVTDERYGVVLGTQHQMCEDDKCEAPVKLNFQLGSLSEATLNTAEAQAGAGAATRSDYFPETLKYRGQDENVSFAMYLLWAFLGGLILNVMPCVLPVIAIKVMGFVQQAGENPRRVLFLNLAYAGGVLLVFAILATLASLFSLTWGGLFQSAGFNIAMTSLVFAMALSLLGVFEIPIPGFAGSGAGGQQEGLPGAFLTGVVATLLATPCSGPFLGVTLAWSVQQSVPVIFAVWLMIGVGMASPYVLFGLNPKLLAWLPKPGTWMVRFKEICGFVLVATAIYLFYIMPNANDRMFLLILLLGIAIAGWILGNFSLPTYSAGKRWNARGMALFVLGLIGWFGWSLTTPSEESLDYQPFSEVALADALKAGKPVLLDFTANWCLTCKTVEKIALNTEGTKGLVEQHDFVVLKADWSEESPEIERWVTQLGSKSIPLLAVFPPTSAKSQYDREPIVLRDLYTEGDVHDAINDAVAGEPASKTTAALD